MTLTLRILNAQSLDNGMPTEFVLHRRGAIIGRSPTCDWCLPDPRNHISSRHCEIHYRDNGYFLTDISTNGTFLNDSPEPLTEPHRLAHGDILQVGQYEVAASLSGNTAFAAEPDAENSAPGSDDWYRSRPAEDPLSDWGPAQASAPGKDRFAWGAAPAPPEPPPPPGGWAPSHRMPDVSSGSPWEQASEPTDPASAWSSAAPDRPPPPRTEDVWGRIAQGNVVDWARGGFGQPAAPERPIRHEEQAADWLPRQPRDARAGFDEMPAPAAPPAPPRPAEPPVQRASAARAPAPAEGERLLAALLTAAGLTRKDVNGSPEEAAARVGSLVARLVAGLVVMLEARTRAKSQMGVETTSFRHQDNNPIKFAGSPEQALAQLINPPQRGFMEPERSVEDAYYDLQSHQMATLKAMQGALKATLDRFSPAAIRGRAPQSALGRMLPMAGKAALWDSYEREFSGVAQGSDEAFMDVFAREFRNAYQEQFRLQGRDQKW